VLRRLTAASLVVLVEFGVLSSPLQHLHLDAQQTEHHQGQALHAHLSGHLAARPRTSGPIADHQERDGRTIAAPIFVCGAAQPFSLAAVPSPQFAFLAPAVRACGRAPRRVYGHDPPFLSRGPSRAPPADPA
jgi:hypothetical protein